jgi:hypothetical protein
MGNLTEWKAENDKQRQRLARLAGRLDAPELARKLGNGWTVADALLHLAFWDWRQREVLLKWQKTGEFVPIPADPETVNAALLAFSRLVPAGSVTKAVLQAAEASDTTVASLPEEFALRVAEKNDRLLRRSMHRAHHLDLIEKALAS